MNRYEYKVVPAPTKGLKAKGVKGPEARFSHAIEDLMNRMAGDGWEYQRAETLPSIERSGLASTTTEWRNVLIFRRLRENDAEAFAPELLPAPEPAAIAASDTAPDEAAQSRDAIAAGQPHPTAATGAEAVAPGKTAAEPPRPEAAQGGSVTHISDARKSDKTDT